MSFVPNNGPAINGGMWVMTILPLIAIILRLYGKSRLGRVFGWDEWVLISSWILLLVYTSCISGSVTLGVGKHLKDIDTANVAPALELVYIGEFIAITACALAKTSFAITLLRTNGIATKPWQKSLLWFVIITMNLIMWMCAIIYLAQCQPTARLWDFTITEGYCWNPKIATDLAIAAGSYSGAMDFVLAILSFVIVWNLNLNLTKREKLGLCFCMSLGVFAGAVAIIKTTYLTNLVLVQDFTFYCSNVLIWACTETGVTQIAVCIPYLRPLLRSYKSNGSSGRAGQDVIAYQLNNKVLKPGGERRSKYRQVGSESEDTAALPEATNNRRTAKSRGTPSQVMSKNTITKTQEVTITYEDAAKVKGSQPNTPTGYRKQDSTDIV